MSTEQQIEDVKKYLQQKICFGLQQAGHATCQACRLARACAPLRHARLAYEEQLLQAEETGNAADAESDALMESMSKAKFEEMIARALKRAGRPSTTTADQTEAIYEPHGPNHSRLNPSAPVNSAGAVAEQPVSRADRGRGKGRPRTAKVKSAQVLILAARGLTRQAVARELGISLASVYRILRENR